MSNSNDRYGMKISELRAGLADIHRVLDSFGAKKQSSELLTLSDALLEFDDLTVPELVKRIKSVGTTAKRKTPAVVNEAAVEEALSTLKSSVDLTESFDSAVETALKDKRLKQGELLEIARRFGGSEPAKSSKAAIASFLKERRLEMKRQGGLGATIDRMLGRSGG